MTERSSTWRCTALSTAPAALACCLPERRRWRRKRGCRPPRSCPGLKPRRGLKDGPNSSSSTQCANLPTLTQACSTPRLRSDWRKLWSKATPPISPFWSQRVRDSEVGCRRTCKARSLRTFSNKDSRGKRTRRTATEMTASLSMNWPATCAAASMPGHKPIAQRGSNRCCFLPMFPISA